MIEKDDMIRITVLVDNFAGGGLFSEHGLSYHVKDEHNDESWLFDAGQSDLFLRNAEKLNINLGEISGVILSHGHYDHGNGLQYLSHKRLICHPDCFTGHYRKKDGSSIGLKMTVDKANEKFDVVTSKVPLQLSDSIWFLGEIPRITDFESKETPFILENGEPDFVDDDSALAIVVGDGLYVLTGCGHAGIVNTIEHAKKVTGVNNLKGVLGGFHLKEYDLQTKKTIDYLKQHEVTHIFPSHCTALPALSAFYEAFQIEQVKTGTTILLD